MRAIAPRLHPFRPRLLDDLAGYDRAASAPTSAPASRVGIVALPLAMAFAIASGVKPEQGIFTAIIAGFLISALGGSSVQIGGPAGAFIVIVYGIVQRYGVANLLIATVLAGVLLLALGWLKLGALVRYIPVSIVIGFTNGIAVLIARLADQGSARPADREGAGRLLRAGARDREPPRRLQPGRARRSALTCFVGLAVLGAAGGVPDAARCARAGLARARRAVVGARARLRQLATRIPGPIVALVVALDRRGRCSPCRSRRSAPASAASRSELPAFVWPAFDWASVQRLFVPTVTIALLGAVESLLCARVADGMATTQRRHDPNQELMAQGIANIVTPFFGGIPATGTIARTVTNLRAGATSPVAGIVHAVVAAGDRPRRRAAGGARAARRPRRRAALRRLEHGRVERVPAHERVLGRAARQAVQHLPAHRPGRPHGGDGGRPRRRLHRLRLPDGRAVPGRARPAHAASAPGVVAYRLYGPLFFAAVAKLEALPDQLPPGTTTLALDAHQLVSIDASGLDAFENVHRALARAGIRLVVVGLNEQPLAAMRKWGLDAVIGAENLFVDRNSAFAALVEAEAQQ